jgi:hypothetical protein
MLVVPAIVVAVLVLASGLNVQLAAVAPSRSRLRRGPR